MGKLNHPGPGAELKELDPPKGLGEQVRKLVLGVDIACLNAPFLQTALDELVPHKRALCLTMAPASSLFSLYTHLKGDRAVTTRKVSKLPSAVLLNRIHLQLHHGAPRRVSLSLYK